MFILFVVKYDSNEEINIETLMSADDPEMLNRVYNNDNYKNAIKKWLPFLNKRGFLDTMIIEEEEELPAKKEEAAKETVDEKKEEWKTVEMVKSRTVKVF